MATRRSVILAIGLAAAGAAVRPVRAAETTARAFVAAIYDAYKGKTAKGIRLDSDAAVRRYFEPSLAALILEDRAAAAKSGDVPSLDGDPFVDAQDFEITALAIAIKDGGPDAAVATVTFKNSGKPTRVVLDLVRLPEGWRIHEVHAPSGDLRTLFSTSK